MAARGVFLNRARRRRYGAFCAAGRSGFVLMRARQTCGGQCLRCALGICGNVLPELTRRPFSQSPPKPRLRRLRTALTPQDSQTATRICAGRPPKRRLSRARLSALRSMPPQNDFAVLDFGPLSRLIPAGSAADPSSGSPNSRILRAPAHAPSSVSSNVRFGDHAGCFGRRAASGFKIRAAPSCPQYAGPLFR